MIDLILQSTQLPNLHPALIHFPIALFRSPSPSTRCRWCPRCGGGGCWTSPARSSTPSPRSAPGPSVWSGGEAEHSLTGLPRPSAG